MLRKYDSRSQFSNWRVDALSKYQSLGFSKEKDAQFGKILHEMRFGDYARRSGKFPYYGSADSTPLFLILVSEIFRWTGNVRFVEKYGRNIFNALEWIDKHGDSNGDGFVDYKKRSPTGLDNQCWEDAWDSMRFADGRLAEPPLAPCEVQVYVYDAKARMAEIAKDVWRDSSLAKKFLDEANELKELFNEKFWIEDKGYYALALDKDDRQVDSLTSNNGQLLWSGIVPKERADLIAEKLLDEDTLFSGYGIRTLSSKNGGYSSIGYHTGCVWPHDNSLIAEGLAKYGKKKEAIDVVDSITEAARYFGYVLPETFAGFSKLKAGFPVRYLTSSSPQAWAAVAPIHFFEVAVWYRSGRSQNGAKMSSNNRWKK